MLLRRTHVALLLVAALVIFGCGGSNPGGLEDSEELWIRGYYAHVVDKSRVAIVSCSVDIRTGGPDGEPVSGLAVTCNGEELWYNGGVYTLDLTDVPPGGDVIFVVSGSRARYTGAVVVPDPPTGLQLSEGAWDFSAPTGSHTLLWDPAVADADSILVSLVGTGPHPWSIASHSRYVPSGATQLTIENADLPSGFSACTELMVWVFQVDTGALDMDSGDSKLWARCGPAEWWNL